MTSKNFIPWKEMSGASVLVTGATGLIGGALTRALSDANKQYALGLHLIAHGRNQIKGRLLEQECGVSFLCGDIRSPMPTEALPQTLDYIFHCAAITSSADMVAKPVDVMTTAVDGTRHILELARERRTRSLVYLSSMEVYGQALHGEIRESDLGYLELSSPRTSYPESKRFCESLCVCYGAQYDIPVKIARLGLTFGAGTPNDVNNTRVVMQFARSAVSGNDIVLHTEGKSVTNCCELSDAVSGLLTILLEGQNGEAYNVANPAASMTIREMAELVANDVCDGKIKVAVNIPKSVEKMGYAPNVGFSLNVDKLKSLGWEPQYGLAEMFRRMIAEWQNLKPV